MASSPKEIIEMAAVMGSMPTIGSSIIGSGALKRSPSPPRSYSDMVEVCTRFACVGKQNQLKFQKNVKYDDTNP